MIEKTLKVPPNRAYMGGPGRRPREVLCPGCGDVGSTTGPRDSIPPSPPGNATSLAEVENLLDSVCWHHIHDLGGKRVLSRREQVWVHHHAESGDGPLWMQGASAVQPPSWSLAPPRRTLDPPFCTPPRVTGPSLKTRLVTPCGNDMQELLGKQNSSYCRWWDATYRSAFSSL